MPYAAYRLVRVLRLFELPCRGWEGWHMHSGKLWSPEGYGFTPADSEWWSNLVRKSHLFHVLYKRQYQLDVAMQRMRTGDGATGTAGPAKAEAAPALRIDGPDGQAAPSPTAQRSGGEADRPNLLLEHFRTENGQNFDIRSSAAIETIARTMFDMLMAKTKGGV